MSQLAVSRRLRLLPWIRVVGAMLCLICVVAVTGFIEYAVAQSSTLVSVRPVAETTTIPETVGDADDPAIWIHPTRPDQSIVITSAKFGGIFTYNLDGTQIEHLLVGRINNVDVRYNFPLNGQSADIVFASKEVGSKGEIKVFRVDPQTRRLVDITANTIPVDLGAYGLCLYHNRASGRYYAFVNEYGRERSGRYQQFELKATVDGRITATLVHQFNVGSEAEGCVADDVHGKLYIAETLMDPNNLAARGLWKYDADPPSGGLDATRPRTLVASFASGHFDLRNNEGEIEGVTIYYTSQHTGYIIVADQNGEKMVLYRREGQNEHVGAFRIVANSDLKIDRANFTDGVDVTNVPLGPTFPAGMFIAQDEGDTPDASDDRNQRIGKNFKLVRWDDIANAFSPPLAIDTTWNPRQTSGAPPAPTPPPSPTPTNPAGCPPATAVGTSLMVSADARVEEESPNTNYGSDTVLRVDGGSDPDAESYLRFDVNTASPVRRATLRVYSFSGSSQAPAVYTSSPSWSESSITWSTRPARSGTPLATVGAVQQNCYIEYDVTAAIPGNGSYSFVLATSITDGVRLSSREGAQPPQLILSLDNQRVLMPLIVR
jgi:myo-inositol-hexaphosphate 3-phosphohydrolase